MIFMLSSMVRPPLAKFLAASVIIAGSLAAGAGSAWAQDAESSDNDTTARPASDVLISEQQRVTTVQTINNIFAHTRSIALRRQANPLAKMASLPGEFGSGIAAGDGSAGMSGFLALSRSSAEDDFVSTAYDSDTNSLSFGADKSFGDSMTVGLSASYSSTDTTSTFNGGSTDTTGWSLSPYAAFVINDMVSIDASAGLSRSESDNTRVAAGATITGTQDSSSRFAALNLNVSTWKGNVGLSGRAGYTYSNTDNDAFTESNGTAIASSSSTFKQISLGGQVSYYAGTVMPYAKLTYNRELGKDRIVVAAGQAQPSNDADEVVLGGGLSIFGSGAMSGGLDISKTLSRSNFDGTAVSGSLSITF